MQANKNGFLYTLDRANGKFISGTPIAKVNWALGLDEATGRPIINPEAKYSATESASITPGPGGAHNWSPMSFNPTLGLLYVSGQSAAGGFTYAVQPNFEYNSKGQNMGIVFGRGPGGPPPAGAAAGGRGGPGAPGAVPAPGAAGENVSPEVAAARAAAAAAAATAPPAPAVPAATPRPPLKTIGPDTNGGFLIARMTRLPPPSAGAFPAAPPSAAAPLPPVAASYSKPRAAPFMLTRRTRAKSCWNSRPACRAAWLLPSRSWWMASSMLPCRWDKAAQVQVPVGTRRRRIRTRRPQ